LDFPLGLTPETSQKVLVFNMGFHWAELIIPLVALAVLVLLGFSIRAFVRGVRQGMRPDS
jgi:hypothetical protein